MKIRVQNNLGLKQTFLADCKLLQGLHFTTSQKFIKQNSKNFDLGKVEKDVSISVQGSVIILMLRQDNELFQFLIEEDLDFHTLYDFDENDMSYELKELVDRCHNYINPNNIFHFDK
ncbi:MAG: hypothetical protein COA80_13705 [Leeuwenhoekiella sp.]|nr:MAG: hypothetical protein COA80_13705 [Leeuwenhoekiella sp.]